MKTDIKAGDLNERVQIQTNTPTTNARGQAVESWATTWTRWAEVIVESGGESETATKITAMRRFNLKLRVLDVTAKMRVKWGDVYMSVNTVIPIGRVGIRLMCTEVAA